jgi:hypothetical protein
MEKFEITNDQQVLKKRGKERTKTSASKKYKADLHY